MLKSVKTLIVIYLVYLSTQLLPESAFGTGACCSVAKGGSGKTSLSLVGSSAWSHEMIADNTYNLTQQAMLLRLGYPFGPGLVLQGQVGLPVATKLSHGSLDMKGNGGIIYGAGLGYELPHIFSILEFYASVSYTRSYGSLDKMDDLEDIDQTFRISEFQGLFLGEMDLSSSTALYGGVRAYSGKNQLKDNRTGTRLKGEREGNLSPLAGLRQRLADNLSLVADGGFGHTKVVGLGAIWSF